jgi:urease accessory protein
MQRSIELNVNMIHSDKIFGNIHSDQDLIPDHHEMEQRGKVEYIIVSRLESQRLRMRKVTDSGTEIALSLPAGSCLDDGDVVFMTREKMVVVKREPEMVASVFINPSPFDDNLLATAVKIGHTIGNLHRPVRIQGNKISFPIQSLTEIEFFEKLFSNLQDQLEIRSDEVIFQEEPAYSIHEH